MSYTALYVYSTSKFTSSVQQPSIDVIIPGQKSVTGTLVELSRGIYRYQNTFTLTPGQGADFDSTVFDKGSWPPPPARAMAEFQKTSDQLKALLEGQGGSGTIGKKQPEAS
jgi:hypothetical protein